MRVLLSFLVAGLFTAQHPEMPAGMSHEEHLSQMQKDEGLKKRGAEAMGFDQDAVTHHFKLSPSGGSIEVTVKDAADQKNLDAIRDHLRSIANRFAAGDFQQPYQTHGVVPPGVTALQDDVGLVAYRYEDLPHGGSVGIETADERARNAVHEFLRYQITEHKTGDRISVKY